MPKTTQIINRRYRRYKNRGRGGRTFLKVGTAMVAATLLAFFLLFAGGVTGVAAVYDYFTRDLPDFTEIERVGQDVDTTFETTKIYAWDGSSGGDLPVAA